MKLKEIAQEINERLKRCEADPKINIVHHKSNTHLYYYAGASVRGRYVSVWYISYQGGSNLTKAEAEQYLDWLKAGNTGTHYQAQKEAQKA